MKVSGFCALFLAVGTALMLFNILSPIVASRFPGFVATTTSSGDKTTLIAVSRKLKENGSGIESSNKVDTGHMTQEDYRQHFDPAPGSSPDHVPYERSLYPFIPKPCPSTTSNPKPVDFIRSNKKIDTGYMTLDDYHPTHPPPGSRDVPFRPHPIEHGSPLNPYIPKPPPPPPSNPE